MRKVVYGAACSLDGFIAGPDQSLDWLHWSDDVNKIMARTWSETDTILMGRKTWEFAMAAGSGGDEDPRMSAMTSYVFSRTLRSVSQPGATLVSDDAGDFVRELKRKKGKDIVILGGGELGRSLFEAGVVDQVGLNIHPVLLGGGTPLFRDAGHRIKLELVECRQLHGGCVFLDYRVKHGRTPKQ